MKATDVVKEIGKYKNTKKAKSLAGYFKIKPGEYGAGDIFWGLSVPQVRTIATRYKDLALLEVKKLLQHKVHECRLCALEILVIQAKINAKAVYTFYLSHTARINNWDLVDLSARTVVGEYLLDKPRQKLYSLAVSKNIWERRIAIVATHAFIVCNSFTDTLKIATILLSDTHDLIHKAVGWMLREVGKRDVAVLRSYLDEHVNHMPRTTLRYAIERFTPALRTHYLSQ